MSGNNIKIQERYSSDAMHEKLKMIYQNVWAGCPKIEKSKVKKGESGAETLRIDEILVSKDQKQPKMAPKWGMQKRPIDFSNSLGGGKARM